jgi:nitrogen fixation NifU-like protein
MNKNKFEKLLEELQRKIEYEEEKIFSGVVIYEYKNPSNFGVIDNPNASGKIKGPCGDTMKITLNIGRGKILDARFWTDGCGATIACGSMLTKLIIGKNIKDIAKITEEQLTSALNGLPEEHLHCSKLAVSTFKKAIGEK